MAKLKHPATLIKNGRIVAKGVSFNAALKLASAANIKGAARRRVNFYKGKSFYFSDNNGNYFAIVATAEISYSIAHHYTISAFDKRADLSDPSSWGPKCDVLEYSANKLIDIAIECDNKSKRCANYDRQDVTSIVACLATGDHEAAKDIIGPYPIGYWQRLYYSYLNHITGIAA